MDMKVRRSMFWRMLLIQAGWNFRRMQNIGWAFSILPALRKLYSGPELDGALRRHLESFNTQPFMAGLALGVAAKMEEERAAAAPEARPDIEERLRVTRSAMSTATAAIGDRLFWGTCRPLAFLLVVFLWWIARIQWWIWPLEHSRLLPEDVHMGAMLLMLLAAMVLYNGFALWVRWKGMEYGYVNCSSSSCGIDFLNWQRVIRVLRITGLGLALVLTCFAGLDLARALYASGMHAGLLQFYAAAIPIVFVSVFLGKRLGVLNMHLYLFFAGLFSVFFFIF